MKILCHLLHLNNLNSTMFLNIIKLHSAPRVTDPLLHSFMLAYTIMFWAQVGLPLTTICEDISFWNE